MKKPDKIIFKEKAKTEKKNKLGNGILQGRGIIYL